MALTGVMVSAVLVVLPYWYFLPFAHDCYSYDSQRFSQDAVINCNLFLQLIPLSMTGFFAAMQFGFWLFAVFKPAQEYQKTAIPAMIYCLLGWIYALLVLALPKLWGFLVGLPILDDVKGGSTRYWNN